MNIFYIDKNPEKAAEYMVDAHVKGKMIVESAQMLANCYTLEQLKQAPLTQSGKYRTHGYPNHPCTKWVKESEGNFNWLIRHAFSLEKERVYRFKSKPHFSMYFIEWCKKNPPKFSKKEMTAPARAFNGCEWAKNLSDPVESYRLFYAWDKRADKAGRKMSVWTNRDVPSWFTTNVEIAEKFEKNINN